MQNKIYKKVFLWFLKFISSVFIIVISLIIIWVISFYGIASMGRMSENITQENIQKIKLGMTPCEVIDILGAPLGTRIVTFTVPSDEAKKEKPYYYYFYSKSGFLWDVDIYVIFDTNRKLDSLNMQEGEVFFYTMYKNRMGKKAIINQNVFDRIIKKAKK